MAAFRPSPRGLFANTCSLGQREEIFLVADAETPFPILKDIFFLLFFLMMYLMVRERDFCFCVARKRAGSSYGSVVFQLSF
ncbi:hypothetical protein CEXT_240861 [Caerostris extrusa]|uniref:Uncharacterized protein n=1 Tax=Caerostris extrusa TaxID=172846 RepID=A0AAV4XHA9_CAEEX|nr:hypothetical protein CEXT_240861 [Caerostris extrusa]